MGLFSSKYVTSVGTTVSRVIQDKDITPSSKTGLVAGLFSKDNNQLIENVLEHMLTGLAVRTERMYSYAKNKYPLGLPESKISLSSDGQAAVIQTLRTVVGSGLTVDYYHFGPLNNLHTGWLMLCTSYGYDSSTNELKTLSTQKGFPVYLKDLVVVVKDATLTERSNGSLDQWGTAANSGYVPQVRPLANAGSRLVSTPTPFRVAPTAIDDAVMVSYVWEVPTVVVIVPEKTEVVNGVKKVTPAITVTRKILKTEETLLPITGYALDKDYFQIKYALGGKEGYWTYQLGAGTYPGIDRLFAVIPQGGGEFFPFVYFRQNKSNLGVNKNTDLYRTSKKMLKTLGMDYQALIDSIHGEGEGAQQNPNLDKVEQALMMFAVSPNSQNPVELRYLYDFFDKLYLASGGVGVGEGWDIGDLGSGIDASGEFTRQQSPEEMAANKLQNIKDSPSIRISIQDKSFKTGLSCQGIFKRKKAGVIAAVGEYTGSFKTDTVTYRYSTRVQTGTTEEGPGGAGGDPIYAESFSTLTQLIDSFIYRLQITDHVYEEIQVYDLKMTYYLFEKYTTVGDDADAILLVPLDHAITEHYPLLDREALYARSLHYVFNSRQVTEVKWYQQGWFADLIMIVGLVLSVLSMGADGGLFAQLGMAVAAGATALTVFVFNLIVDYVIIQLGLKLFVKIVGAEFAFLVAIVATAYGGFKAYTAGSVAGAPWAKELLQLGNGLASAVSSSMADAMQGLKEEYEEFSLLAKEQIALLENANKLLEQQTVLSPVVIFGESPDDFYNRTVHAGNIGILGIDSIASFVDIALTLPKLNDTLEGNSYA